MKYRITLDIETDEPLTAEQFDQLKAAIFVQTESISDGDHGPAMSYSAMVAGEEVLP